MLGCAQKDEEAKGHTRRPCLLPAELENRQRRDEVDGWMVLTVTQGTGGKKKKKEKRQIIASGMDAACSTSLATDLDLKAPDALQG